MKKGKKKILIVEDELSMLKALNEKFTKEGYEIIEGRDGEDGIEKALKYKPDLILLDIIMPRLDGMTMLKELRKKSKWGKDVKVILLTNLSDAEAVGDALEYGVFDYLVKSDWKLEDVVKLVNEKLESNF